MGDFLEKINIRKLLRYLLFMFLALAAQSMVIGQIRIMGVAPMVLPAVAVAMGMFKGATLGPLFSLVMGIYADMAFVENTIGFTVLFPVLSFAAAFVAQFFVNRRFFAFMGLSFMGLLITALFQMLKTLAGDAFCMAMITTAVLQTLWSLPFSALAYFPPAKWIQ